MSTRLDSAGEAIKVSSASLEERGDLRLPGAAHDTFDRMNGVVRM